MLNIESWMNVRKVPTNIGLSTSNPIYHDPHAIQMSGVMARIKCGYETSINGSDATIFCLSPVSSCRLLDLHKNFCFDFNIFNDTNLDSFAMTRHYCLLFFCPRYNPAALKHIPETADEAFVVAKLVPVVLG